MAVIVVPVAWLVMGLVDDRGVLVDRIGRMGVSLGMGMPVAMVTVMIEFVARGVAGMRAEQRDQAGQNGAQQRQENDCLNHLRAQPFIRLTSSTAIEPRLRK